MIKTTLQHSTLIKYGMAAAIATLLAFLFSYSNAFPYKYQEGGTWNYADLYASQNIPLELSNTEQDSILTQVEQQYAPVFKMNKDVLAQKKVQFEQEFKKQLNFAGKDNAFPDANKSAKSYYQFGERLLSKIYEQGILPDNASLDGKSEIQIARTESTKTQLISKTFTKKTAFDIVTDSLPASSLREPEFLLSVFEGVFEPNLVYDEAASQAARTHQFQKFVQKRDTLYQGTLIIAKGATINDVTLQQLETYRVFIENGKGTGSFGSRFFLFWSFSFFLLAVLLAHFATLQRQLFDDNSFLILLTIMIVALQVVHFLLQKQESHALFSPILLFPIFLKRYLLPYVNVVTHTVMVLLASQIVDVPYSFCTAFICGGYFLIFAETRFLHFPNGKYLHLVASAVIVAFGFTITTLQQHQVLEIPKICLAIVLQVILMSIAPLFIQDKTTTLQ
jgi:7TM-HD extracellular